MLLLSTRLPATSQSSVLVMRERWAPGASTSAKSGFQAGITTTLQSSPATRPGPRHGAPPRLPLPPLRAPTPHSTLPPLRAPTPHSTLPPLRAPTPHSTLPPSHTPPPARPQFTIRHRSCPFPAPAGRMGLQPTQPPHLCLGTLADAACLKEIVHAEPSFHPHLHDRRGRRRRGRGLLAVERRRWFRWGRGLGWRRRGHADLPPVGRERSPGLRGVFPGLHRATRLGGRERAGKLGRLLDAPAPGCGQR